MEAKRLQEYAGKQAGDTNQLKLISGFDDDDDWSDDSASAVSAAGAKDQELNRCTSEAAQATDMEVSPLVRSIFENRKKLILDASQKAALRKDHVGGGSQLQCKHGPQREQNSEYEKMLQKKVQALDEEVAIFKKESKRLKNLSKEHADGLTKLAREKAEWEEQKKSQMQAFQAQQEEQIEKLKKEKQLLDHRSAALNSLPAAQRKDVEELKETLARQQEEHRGKELRLRLTINRLRAMNEDLTRQVLEMQDEIRRYETCLLSALDGRENSAPFSKRPCGEADHRHACATPPPEPARGIRRTVVKTTKQCSMVENSCTTPATSSADAGAGSEQQSHCRSESISTPRLLSEQAKTLSDLFSRPWSAAGCVAKCVAKEDCASMSRHLMGHRFADWR
ncbi:hypothetical protein KC19_2G086400 [Ceratodon purpureus]|uniref:Uncharacterized protein n=1 Tax=Ceratodon purpureus TaxID=3225 RepID=A0A8T0IUI3_CERPU|nr:hypothetical protein KC19_2G086400 [Ceratodon purpureus]